MPVDEVAHKFHEEREARRMNRDLVSSPSRSMLDMTNPTLASRVDINDPEFFSRTQAQAALAWRVLSCSNPTIENPLLARMTEFWFNHFNVSLDKGTVRPFVGNYLLTSIRPHALGKFEDLVLATAQHPAMLMYLDQAQSTARGLNENYARELMELHTLGVQGGYTQADVRVLARMLTGWSVDLSGGRGFLFRPRAHEEGAKTMLGKTFDAKGQQQGVDAIRFLARHPATAQRIARRIASFFVADEPPPGLVQRLAQDFQQSGGDIRSLLRTLVESPEFWDATHKLFKTPLDFACSALAATASSDRSHPETLARAWMQGMQPTVGFLAQTGQPLLRWPTPDGYATDRATWLAPEALTRRADFAFTLAQRVPEPVHLLQFYSSATRERIAQESSAQARTGLMLAGPEFMWK